MKTTFNNQFPIVLLILSITGSNRLTSAGRWYTALDKRQYYIEGSTKYNWLQAMDKCSRLGLQLAVIDNPSKNEALVKLLRSIFRKSPDLWIGHHDEFNRAKNKNRGWYAASSGRVINFGYWRKGEPNNKKKNEHCTQIYRKADFKWNDETCDNHYFGYICEEHYLKDKYKRDMTTKQNTMKQRNNELLSSFNATQNRVQENLVIARNETGNILELWERSCEVVFENFIQSLEELIKRKPYLQAVVADIGASVYELALEAKKDISTLTTEARRSIEEIQLNCEKAYPPT
uniref:Uncharacterized protein n=1 Tax=Musca domestica TaxID=7370 RepID=A0A1I8NGW7_MUSDO